LYPGQLSRRFYTCYGYCPFWPGGNPYSSHNTKPGYPGLGLLPPQSDDDNPKEETYKGQRVGHWTKSLKNWDSHVRGQAANALAHLGPKAHDAIPDLIDTLKDSDPMVRVEAASALAAVGSDAVKPLMEALKKSDKQVRMGAALALGHLGARGMPFPLCAISSKTRTSASARMRRKRSGASPAMPRECCQSSWKRCATRTATSA
jgi:hypothetical protein